MYIGTVYSLTAAARLCQCCYYINFLACLISNSWDEQGVWNLVDHESTFNFEWNYYSCHINVIDVIRKENPTITSTPNRVITRKKKHPRFKRTANKLSSSISRLPAPYNHRKTPAAVQRDGQSLVAIDRLVSSGRLYTAVRCAKIFIAAALWLNFPASLCDPRNKREKKNNGSYITSDSRKQL